MKTYKAILSSPLGKLGIVTTAEYLLNLDFLNQDITEQPAEETLALEVCNQLNAYFKDQNHLFSLPLAEKGTAFQQRVWQHLRLIQPGTTLTYGQLAKQLQTSARAIGNACRHNPLPIITPCHRIVAATHLGGYSGQTTGSIWQIKQWLLQHEDLGKADIA
ncbi:MAG: ogt [Gammaproteobacteria bacterium]|jgi:methylated-DNA-[protein]-cysteine S-methyltransferase|nr:ogt [Gammaproteobacteria bacterium]